MLHVCFNHSPAYFPRSWASGSVPYNSSELDFTSDTRYTTTIPSGTIRTGRMIFPRNGRFRFCKHDCPRIQAVLSSATIYEQLPVRLWSVSSKMPPLPRKSSEDLATNLAFTLAVVKM